MTLPEVLAGAGTKYVWTDTRCLEKPGSVLDFNWMDTKQARLEDSSLYAQSFDHFRGELFGRVYCIAYCSLLLGPNTTTYQSIGRPSRSQLTSHSRLATVSLRPWAETHATWQSLKCLPLSASRPSVKAQCRLVWAPC